MKQPLRVLVVEDSEDDALLLLTQLWRGGYEPTSQRVQTAAALTAALAESDWDVVLSDYQMPGFDGLRALETVQASGRDLPFILVSGVMGEELAVAAMKAGAHDYLLKDKLARLVPAVERELREADGRRQRQRAERALRESEQRLRLALAASRAGVWEWHPATGAVVWSPETCELYGRAPDQGAPAFPDWVRLLHPEDIERTNQAFHNALAHPGQELDTEFRIHHPQRGVRWLLAVGQLESTPDGIAHRMCGINLDITERKAAEETLSRLNAELEGRVAQRTAELGATVSRLEREALKRQQAARKLNQANAQLRERSNQLRGLVLELSQVEERERRRVAHVLHEELQQLLVSIRLHTDFVAARANTAPLRAEGAIATHIVDEALTVTSTLTSELFPPVLLDSSFATALRWLGRWMHHRHRLTVRVRAPATLAPLARDFSGMLFQCVRELLFNVVKHARVTAATVQVSQRSRLLQIVVTDRGAGFTPTKVRAQPVLGSLGLHSIRERIDSLGGKMEVRSAPGQGTAVTLRLPCIARRASRRSGTARKPSP